MYSYKYQELPYTLLLLSLFFKHSWNFPHKWVLLRTTTNHPVINCLASLIFLGQKVDLVSTQVLHDFPASLVFCGMSLFSSKFVQAIALWITVWFTQNQILDRFGACSLCWALPVQVSGLSAAAKAPGGMRGLAEAGPGCQGQDAFTKWSVVMDFVSQEDSAELKPPHL